MGDYKKRSIRVDLDIGAEVNHCGCANQHCQYVLDMSNWCRLFDAGLTKTEMNSINKWNRCPQCLNAEMASSLVDNKPHGHLHVADEERNETSNRSRERRWTIRFDIAGEHWWMYGRWYAATVIPRQDVVDEGKERAYAIQVELVRIGLKVTISDQITDEKKNRRDILRSQLADLEKELGDGC